MGLFSEAGDPRLGLTLPIGDSGARLGVIASSDDMVRICRCAEMGPSLGKPVSAFQYNDAQYTDAQGSISVRTVPMSQACMSPDNILSVLMYPKASLYLLTVYKPVCAHNGTFCWEICLCSFSVSSQ